MTDEMLVKLYAEGDNNAFDVLLERHEEKIFSYIFFIVRNKHVASFLGMTPGYHTLNNNYKQPTLSKLKDIFSKIFYDTVD